MSNQWIPDICIFHNVVENFACPDGLAAAWVVSLKFKDINPNLKFIGMTYLKAKERLTFENEFYQDKNIIIVDFSLSREMNDLLFDQGCTVRIIDHHKSFLKETVDSQTYNLLHQGKSFKDQIIYQRRDKSYTFDSYSCGAALTWRMLFEAQPIPEFLEIIRQNDIFDFIDADAEAIHFGMAKIKRSFALFDQLYQDCLQGDWEFTRKHLADLGQPSIDKKLIQFEKIINNSKKFQEYLGIPIIILNKSEMMLKSRIAKYTNEKFVSPFTIILDKELTRVRVKGNDFDLLGLFADYGAVGHSAACSFDWSGSFEEVKELVGKVLRNIREYSDAA
jgi:oligoribonuclease NrnB/cAMP/cGMP phosphodiesterase (DHH superfamily)